MRPSCGQKRINQKRSGVCSRCHGAHIDGEADVEFNTIAHTHTLTNTIHLQTCHQSSRHTLQGLFLFLWLKLHKTLNYRRNHFYLRAPSFIFQLDYTSRSLQRCHQYPPSSLLYCNVNWQCPTLEPTESFPTEPNLCYFSFLFSISFPSYFYYALTSTSLPSISAPAFLLSQLSLSSYQPRLAISLYRLSLFSIHPISSDRTDSSICLLFFRRVVAFVLTARSPTAICTIMWNPAFHCFSVTRLPIGRWNMSGGKVLKSCF